MENARRITYNFICFISGTVKLHNSDTVNPCHIIHIQKILKERFLIKKKSQRPC